MVAIVDTKCAKMPGSVRAPYVLIRVLDVRYDLATAHEQGKWSPRSVNAREVNRVYRQYGAVPRKGTTSRSGYVQTMTAARALANSINSAGDQATAEQIIGAGGSA
jgi:hypothetical protein